MNTTGEQDFSIVAVSKFIQATRDSGYKGTSSAIAELIDNSLQAGATSITVSLTVDLEEDELAGAAAHLATAGFRLIIRLLTIG